MANTESATNQKQAEALARFDQAIRAARDRAAHRKAVKLVGARQYKKLRRLALNELQSPKLEAT